MVTLVHGGKKYDFFFPSLAGLDLLQFLMEPDAGNSLLSPGSYLRERWEIVKKIGGGGFGEIYRALDHSTDQVRLIAQLHCCKRA